MNNYDVQKSRLKRPVMALEISSATNQPCQQVILSVNNNAWVTCFDFLWSSSGSQCNVQEPMFIIHNQQIYYRPTIGKVPLKFKGELLLSYLHSLPFLNFLYPFRIFISFRRTSKSCLIVAALLKQNTVTFNVITENTHYTNTQSIINRINETEMCWKGRYCIEHFQCLASHRKKYNKTKCMCIIKYL